SSRHPRHLPPFPTRRPSDLDLHRKLRPQRVRGRHHLYRHLRGRQRRRHHLVRHRQHPRHQRRRGALRRRQQSDRDRRGRRHLHHLRRQHHRPPLTRHPRSPA